MEKILTGVQSQIFLVGVGATRNLFGGSGEGVKVAGGANFLTQSSRRVMAIWHAPS